MVVGKSVGMALLLQQLAIVSSTELELSSVGVFFLANIWPSGPVGDHGEGTESSPWRNL